MAIKRRERAKDTVKDIKRSLRRSTSNHPTVEFLGSGSTGLNLALSGKGVDGGWARGRVCNIVGDGSSGKTLLALEVAFWFYHHIKKIRSKIYRKVKKLEICYDNGEGVMDFPVDQMYGEEFYNAINWDRSPHFEAMCRRFIRKANSLKVGHSLLYIIDSWDSFQSAASKKAFEDSVKNDTDLKGDYDLLVQKYASRKFFPAICGAMDQNKVDATLIIISQVRSKIGIKFGKKQYRAGGKALDFYTHQVAWISEIEKLSKSIRKHNRVYGIRSAVKVERSKVAKPFREAIFNILFDYGLDDVGAMTDFLFGTEKIKFQGKEFKTRKSFIRYIERGNLENELAKETEEVWQEIEDSFTKDIKRRKKRY